MRIALVQHAFPPAQTTGVEVYGAALADALGRAGHQVEVFAARREQGRAHLSQRREVRERYAVTWLTLAEGLDEEDRRRSVPGAGRAFQRFLDREQPDVVHFQHVLRLGVELIDTAKSRGLPVLYTAHDPFPVTNEYTLLAPDLSPLDVGDISMQARCRMARGVLDEHLDAHDGFLAPDEAPEVARAVQAVLHGADVDREHLDDLTSALTKELAERLDILARVDHFETPTHFLAELFERAGLKREIVVRPCGIDTAPLEKASTPGNESNAPLRLLYLGGYYEHKGVHVLLDAFEGLADRVELQLRGLFGSGRYGADLRKRAAAVGAQLGGPFERSELPSLLEACDLIVVPSLWPENAPFVIREAFAARRPVIASDSPALAESIRDGLDGRLVRAGDAAALRGVIEEYSDDRGALARLAAGVRSPLSIEEDARAAVAIYQRLKAPRASARTRRLERLPAHVRPFAARHAELASLPTRELVARASAGLDRLAASLELPERDGAALGRLIAGGDRLRERHAEARRALSWREQVVRDRERAMASLEARLTELEGRVQSESRRADWKAELLEEREARLVWESAVIDDQNRALESQRTRIEDLELTREEYEKRMGALITAVESLTEEREWLARNEREAQEAAAWRARQLDHQGDELTWVRSSLSDREAHLAEAEQALVDVSAKLNVVLAERAWLRESLEEAQTHLRGSTEELEALHRERAATQDHEAWLRGELARALSPLLAAAGEPAPPTPEDLGPPEAVTDLVSAALQRLRDLGDELDWRVREMERAREESDTLGQRLVGGRLRRRVDSWGVGAQAREGDEPGSRP